MQYRSSTFVTAATPAAVTLALGFVPDRINVFNLDVMEVNPPNDAAPGEAFWLKTMPNASAVLTTYTTGVPAVSYITSAGFTPYVVGGDWQNTQYVITAITKANPGVVTVSSVTPANSMTLVNGMTFTISGVVGMTNVNTNRYIVAGISGTSFNLYDTFGNPVDTTAFGTYVSGGIVNVISYPPTGPILNPVTGQVITSGNPAGLQLDIGFEGITIGTGVIGDAGDTIWWEAFTMTPTGW